MIIENPGLRDMFSFSAQETGHQANALAGALYAYATHIDDLTPLVPVVTRIANKHAGLGVTPEQYAIVGTYLLKSIKDILGDAFTDPIRNAWYQVRAPLSIYPGLLYLR
jgi:nitric oxide dioxygenase